MPQVSFISSEESTTVVEGDVGQSVMELAKRGGVAAIVAECGGSCACATCHVVVAGPWWDRLDAMSSDEDEMLEFVSGRRPTSRLACQIRLTNDLDGLTVGVPDLELR